MTHYWLHVDGEGWYLPTVSKAWGYSWRGGVALAWAFICIMDEVAKLGVLHNDLLPPNIVLHIQFDTTLRIGVAIGGLPPGLRRSQDQFLVYGLRRKNNTWDVNIDVCSVPFFTFVAAYVCYETATSHRLQCTLIQLKHIRPASLPQQYGANVLMIPPISAKMIRPKIRLGINI